MITKQLVHDIVTFFNNYIENKYVMCNLGIYTGFISCHISIWSLSKKGYIGECVHAYNTDIRDDNDFIEYKRKVLDTINGFIKEAENLTK